VRSVGVPIEPMLGHICRSFDAMALRAVKGEHFACERK
jgi:hypothetical protein